MGIKKLINRAGAKAADKIAKLSALSPEQLKAVEEQKEKYLADQPDISDEELTSRLLASCGVEIFNSYLEQIKELYIPLENAAEFDDVFNPSYNIRYFNITKWVTDKKENSLEKLVNVYEVLSNEHCNIGLVFHRTENDTQVYLAVINTQNATDNVNIENYRKRLLEAIKGNFPGSTVRDEIGRGRIPALNNHKPYSVATVSNLPAAKSEKFISQTIEKLIDGIVPENPSQDYTLILLASPIQDIENRKLRLSELYSALAPFERWQTNYTFTSSDSTTSMATFGVNVGASAGIQHGHNQAVNQSSGTTESSGDSTTDSTGQTDGTNSSHTSGESKGSSDTVGGGANYSENAGVTLGAPNVASVNVGASVGAHAEYSHSWNRGTSVSDTIGKSTAKTVGKALTKTASKAISETLGKTVGASRAVNFGSNIGANFARASNVTATVGKNEGITQNFMNHTIHHALSVLDEQMKRFEKGTALGMWEFAAYVVSEDQNIANNVAHTYLALTQGEESYMSRSSVNLWRGDMGESSSNAREIVSYLRDLRHPLFGLNPNILLNDSSYCVYPALVTPTVPLSGQELAYSLNFPQKSIPGLPILECTEFGRNIVSYDLNETQDEKLHLGHIFHMNHEENISVDLSQNSLTSHAFITGSTGSGKSNTIYQLLNEARENEVKFLVVEPAKGEYKHVFGNDEDVSVYGTNPSLTPLLQLNPFSFSKEIHLLEHLDRLIEIFNVCWPMYAAMPAVLKKAVEKSYEDCGWDLIASTNPYGNLYPNFQDVADNIKEIIDSSEYDNENKGAYKGALLTRIESLTNGINGLIFSQKELSNQELFDSNVIIDLSRVGSTETKSLIMGILVLKLQEYRMTQAEMNTELRHLTVLEEAHNLLKRTSTEQSSESGNLLGKSVEMLANSIAEMRTYGEGFIIADQAPGLLDLSVIRNTNTKIIMRLPDLSDRELVGRAANLNDDQILELAKLPKGVAAVYQNEWIQPVLCKVEKVDSLGIFSRNQTKYFQNESLNTNEITRVLVDWILNKWILRIESTECFAVIKKQLLHSNLKSRLKYLFLHYNSSLDNNDTILGELLYELLAAKQAIENSKDLDDVFKWSESVVNNLEPSIKGYNSEQINLILLLIINEQSRRDKEYENIFKKFVESYKVEGGVF
ncbi:helicase HerA domain-containing protein [Streptococcus panodentis]|uniref:ATP-binding protein n=1 Tax=Streptococcus panodentis TaxID=1581472 RepID=A0ABS5ATH1_9STRE|nr:ATP-binding protein [Streptococcus panodentis]MBP2619877.1 ATP-binding protein [Streptococcus panodentis]